MLAAASTGLVFGIAKRQCVHNETVVTAAFLGQEQLAFVEAQPKSVIAGTDSFAWLGNGIYPISLNNQQFTVNTQVETYIDERFRRVTVTVGWEENGQTVRQSYGKLVKIQ